MATMNIENGKRIDELVLLNTLTADAVFAVNDQNLTRKITLTNLRAAFNGDTADSNKNNLYYSVEKADELYGQIRDDIGKLNLELSNMEDRIGQIYNEFGGDLSEFKKEIENVIAELRLSDTNINNRITTEVNRINGEITNLNTRITNETTRVNGEISRLDKSIETTNTRITTETTRIDGEIKKTNDKLDEEVERLDGDIATINSTIQNIQSDIGDINTEISNIKSRLGTAETDIDNIQQILGSITSITIGKDAPSNLANGAIYLQYFD